MVPVERYVGGQKNAANKASPSTDAGRDQHREQPAAYRAVMLQPGAQQRRPMGRRRMVNGGRFAIRRR